MKLNGIVSVDVFLFTNWIIIINYRIYYLFFYFSVVCLDIREGNENHVVGIMTGQVKEQKNCFGIFDWWNGDVDVADKMEESK